MNVGKSFEQQIRKSVPLELFCYRLIDGTASWNGANTRFQATNIADYIFFNGQTLYFVELKSTQGTSIPFSMLRQNQVDGLDIEYPNIVGYFIFNFRKYNKTYAVPAKIVSWYMQHTDRKSIAYEWIVAHGELIPQKLKITNYTYDLSMFLRRTGEQ